MHSFISLIPPSAKPSSISFIPPPQTDSLLLPNISHSSSAESAIWGCQSQSPRQHTCNFWVVWGVFSLDVGGQNGSCVDSLRQAMVTNKNWEDMCGIPSVRHARAHMLLPQECRIPPSRCARVKMGFPQCLQRPGERKGKGETTQWISLRDACRSAEDVVAVSRVVQDSQRGSRQPCVLTCGESRASV